MTPRTTAGRLRAGAILGLGQMSLRGAVAGYSLLLVHLMSRAAYGDFSFVLALLGMLVILADGGFTRLLTRDVARVDADHAPIITSLLLVRAGCVALVVALLLVVAAVGGVWMPAAVAALLALAVGSEATAVGFESAALGTEQPWRIVIGQLLATAVLVLSGFAVWVLEPSVELAVGGLAAASTVKALWQAFAWREIFGQRTRPAEGAGRWLRQAFPFLVVAGLGVAYYRIDMVILYARAGAVETASYGAAYRVVDAAIMLGGIAAAAMVAHLSRLHQNAPGQILSSWAKYCGWTLLVALPAIFLLFLAADPAAALLFGDRYREPAGEDLRYLAPGILFMLLQVANAVFLFTGDVERLVVRLGFLSLAFNLGLTWVLVGRSGSAGAAAATSISELLTFLLYGSLVWRRFGPAGADAAAPG